MGIEGSVALVTGASSGIGEGIARALAKSKVKVGLAARRLDRLNRLVKEIEAAGGEAMAIELDVTDPKQNAAAVNALTTRYGSLDIAVLNAGLMPLSDIESLKTDEWSRMVDVNIKGLLNTAAAVLPKMMAAKRGHVFVMSSIAGRKVFKGLSVYCATKHAIAAFADGMRMELAPKYNIRVTCVQPGAVATELYDHITDAGYRKQMDELAATTVFLQPKDIAEAVVYAAGTAPHIDVAELFIMPTSQGW
jgi:NADP-dependent 3-hydroxy acid dehydrogenase YdfG